ncbi:MAG: glutathione S-transferase family protein [Bdellovibrionales bacterium]|nr:glutathione S-transferase family protein [Bdellovibrionales bacterium]
MYKLMGYNTQNTMKALYVLEELGVDYEFQLIDLSKGEQRSESFLNLTPIGKVPVLSHENHTLFESGAICRYIANVENSQLYPQNKFERAQVDQWMDFFSCHLGRWLSALYFEKVIKSMVGLGSADPKKCEDAIKFCEMHLPQVDKWLETHKYFANDKLSIADLFAFAYIEQAYEIDFPLNNYKHLHQWFEEMKSKNSISQAKKKFLK